MCESGLNFLSLFFSGVGHSGAEWESESGSHKPDTQSGPLWSAAQDSF